MRTEALPESEIGQRVSVARVEGLGRERYVNVARAEWHAYRAMVFDMVVRGGFEVCPSSHGCNPLIKFSFRATRRSQVRPFASGGWCYIGFSLVSVDS